MRVGRKVLRGTIQYNKRNYEDALTNFLDASRRFEEIGNIPQIGAMKTNLSGISWQMQDTTNTFKYLKEAIFYYRQVEDETKIKRLAQAYTNLGNMYKNISKLDSSEFYLEQSILHYQMGKYTDQLGQPLKTLGTVKQQQGKIEEALVLYDKALKTFE